MTKGHDFAQLRLDASIVARMRYLKATVLALLAVLAVAPVTAGASAPPAKHVWVFMLENKSLAQTFVAGAARAPYLTQELPRQGAFVPSFYGIGHSSLDNYIAQISGQGPAPQTQDDCPDREYHDMAPFALRADGQVVDQQSGGTHGCIYPTAARTLATQLDEAGLTWRAYAEGIPEPCSQRANGTTNPEYRRKHVPFLFFRAILDDRAKCQQRVVGLDPLGADIADPAKTPGLSYIVPDQCNDAHDQCDPDDPSSLARADAFLKRWIPKIQSSEAYRQDGLIIVTFDEGNDIAACCGEVPGPNSNNPGYGGPSSGGGMTGAVMLSPFIAPQTVSLEAYNQYSLLRSLEDMYGIGEHLAFAGASGLRSFGDDIFTAPHATTAAPAPAPAKPVPACVARPEATVAFQRVRLSRRGVAVRGRARTGCGDRVSTVEVAVGRRVGARCTWLRKSGRPGRPTTCRKPEPVAARGVSRWSRDVRTKLRAGRYEVVARVTDVAARRSAVARRTLRLR